MVTEVSSKKIEFRGVSKSFKSPANGRKSPAYAVLDLDFEVRDGEFFTLIGPSGCGKTTTLKLLAGLLTPEGGEILVDDEPVTGPGSDRSMVFQHFNLLPWRTVLGNVEFGLELQGVAKREREKVAKEYIQLVELQGYEDHYPHQLSGGMKQRVGLARSFAVEPEVLLMDEPFGALDAQTREHLQDEFLRICPRMEKTVIFVTHNIDEAIKISDRICVLSSRPGTVKEIVGVDLPDERWKYEYWKEDHYVELKSRLTDLLEA